MKKKRREIKTVSNVLSSEKYGETIYIDNGITRSFMAPEQAYNAYANRLVKGIERTKNNNDLIIHMSLDEITINGDIVPIPLLLKDALANIQKPIYLDYCEGDEQFYKGVINPADAVKEFGYLLIDEIKQIEQDGVIMPHIIMSGRFPATISEGRFDHLPGWMHVLVKNQYGVISITTVSELVKEYSGKAIKLTEEVLYIEL